jgi:hypothetical protein
MKIIRATMVLTALVAAMVTTPVLARGGHGHQFRGHQARHHHVRPHHGFSHHSHGFRHHSHARFGLFIGAPLLFAPWYYPAYPAPAVVIPSSPPVYIEQGQAAAPAQEAQYWYYCRESETYYPYVKECAGPWQRVVPQPPPS